MEVQNHLEQNVATIFAFLHLQCYGMVIKYKTYYEVLLCKTR